MRPSVSDSIERPWPVSQRPPKSPVSLRLTIQVLQQLSIGLDEELQLRMRALQPPNELEGVEVGTLRNR